MLAFKFYVSIGSVNMSNNNLEKCFEILDNLEKVEDGWADEDSKGFSEGNGKIAVENCRKILKKIKKIVENNRRNGSGNIDTNFNIVPTLRESVQIEKSFKDKDGNINYYEYEVFWNGVKVYMTWFDENKELGERVKEMQENKFETWCEIEKV